MTKKEVRKKRAAYMRAYRLKHLDQERLRDRVRYMLDPEGRKAISRRATMRRMVREGRSATKRRQRDAWFKCVYGITDKNFQAMKRTQGEKCAICRKRPKKSTYRSLHVDHNHTTGAVRALLCGRCNVKLHVIEDRAWCVLGLRYLKEHHRATPR